MSTITQNLEALEADHAAAKQQLRGLVESASTQSDRVRIAELTSATIDLVSRIEVAKAEREQERLREARLAHEDAETRFWQAIERATPAREKFLQALADSQLSWGDMISAMTEATEAMHALASPNFGTPVHYANALRALDLGDEPQIILRKGHPFVDGDWKTQITLTPRRRTL